jgi:predicted ABC-type ATPase
MAPRSPRLVVIAGPNGAGKSTSAPALLRDLLGIREFVNADAIAQGMSGFDPDAAAMAAGRTMLARLHELATARRDFAFETTLTSRTFAPWISALRESGYQFALVFLSLPSPDMAIARVAQRVASGGHHVPASTVRRRFQRGLENFFSLYRPLAHSWRLYDNSGAARLRLIADGGSAAPTRVFDEKTWNSIEARCGA